MYIYFMFMGLFSVIWLYSAVFELGWTLSSGSGSSVLHMSWFQVKEQKLPGGLFLLWWRMEPQEGWQNLTMSLIASAVSNWHGVISAQFHCPKYHIAKAKVNGAGRIFHPQ